MEKLLETTQDILYLYQVMEIVSRLVLKEMMVMDLDLAMSEYLKVQYKRVCKQNKCKNLLFYKINILNCNKLKKSIFGELINN